MRYFNKKRNIVGFTLIELLIVIGILAILAALAFVALNPLARFQDSRNARRWADVNAILSAARLYQVDNDGTHLSAIGDLTADYYYQIGAGDTCNDACSTPTVTLQSDCVDLEELADEKYITSVPIDPNATGASEDETRYYLVKQTGGIIIVGSCSEEQGSDSTTQSISVSR